MDREREKQKLKNSVSFFYNLKVQFYSNVNDLILILFILYFILFFFQDLRVTTF